MSFMWLIINALNSVSSWFYEIYLEVNGWVWPFYLAADFFYQLHGLFNTLAWRFYDFSNWVNEVASKISQILNWDNIWSFILSYVPNLTQVRDWFYSWWNNVTSVISTWWSSTQYTVLGWIFVAVQPFNTVLDAWNNFWNYTWPDWSSRFNTLKSAFDNFWSYNFPNLVNFSWLWSWWNGRLTDVQWLMNSTLRAWFPFYNDLAQLWGTIALFFTNPVEFIWQRFVDWFLGPEG